MGGSSPADWAGGIGAGEEGAENRDDGESWVWPVIPRVGVAGYDKLNDSQQTNKDGG